MTDQATPASTQTETATPSSVTTTTTVKPGLQTTEFYLHLAAVILSAVLAGGLITDDQWLRIAGVIGAVLSAYGYSVTRAAIKTAAMPMLAVLLLWHSSGCATSSRNKALGADVAVLDTANAAVDAYEHKHTQDLITAEKGAQLELDVATWRVKVDKVRADIDGGYKLAAAAGVANDAPSLKTLEDFLAALHAELVTLGAVSK